MLQVRGAVAVLVAIHSMVILTVACAAFAGAVVVVAQTPTAANQDAVVFDVASVRPDRRQRGPLEPQGLYLRMQPGGRFEASTTLRNLIIYAYGLRPYQRVQGFEALLGERFAIVARVAAGVTLAEGDERRLVGHLLSDRFNLRVRFDDRSEAVSFLRRGDAGRLGPGLRPSPLDCSVDVPLDRDLDRSNPFRRCTNGFFSINGRLATVAPSMSAFADLQVFADRPVIDGTGLAGVHDLDVEFAYDPANHGSFAVEDSDSPSLFVAVQDQLGLKLESTRGMLDVFVIDHAERPTEN